MPETIVTEKWQPCFAGFYSVSNFGRVRREIARSGTFRGRVVKPRMERAGYLTVNLKAKERGAQTHFVHRLVAEAFLGSCPEGMEINHINGNKRDAHVENLEYVTHSDNKKHAFRIGLQQPASGMRNGHAKLNDQQVREIRARRANGETGKHLSETYGISPSIVSEIVHRRIWKHIA